MADGAPDAPATASAYAGQLLRGLGLTAGPAPHAPAEAPALAWAGSGLMWLTGRRDGAPLMCAAPLASCADGALAALASVAPDGALDGLRGAALLAERAAIAGHARNGRTSPGGSCRLLTTRDGCIALSLARADDWALLPAWLEADVAPDWDAVAARVRHDASCALVDRGRELGLAVADAMADPWKGSREPAWLAASRFETPAPGSGRASAEPLVVDLSSLWAGPLCSHLLQLCGARVVKLESARRPDGARHGPSAFFDLLNAGKRSVALDFGAARGREQLYALLRRADIVIEGSRPRALRQIGVDAAALMRERPGMTWVGIGGYGRGEPHEHWAAYGDDAGAAAGLSRLMLETAGEAVICGDAIADPLTGIHAALAAWASHRAGGGRLVSLALRDVVRHCMTFQAPASPAGLQQRHAEWTAIAQRAGVARPVARRAATAARALGADTPDVLGELGIPC